jgi:hypothetical protein
MRYRLSEITTEISNMEITWWVNYLCFNRKDL